MAVIAKQRYKLDIAPKGGWVIVYASQHDNGAREIEFEITNQGNAFSIPASINVSVQGIKSNKSYFSHSCSYSGNIVTMALADDMTDIIGKAICVLKFTNQANQKLATAKFVLNVDTDSSSEGIIIDTEAEEIFNQMLNEIRAQAASVSADIAELQSMVGSPLVASLVSEMIDTDKIYVYVGSESGYTNGNWYYWNGSAWTSGGVYNSVAFETDTTLTLLGQPADAKVVGDRLGVLDGSVFDSYIETLSDLTKTATSSTWNSDFVETIPANTNCHVVITVSEANQSNSSVYWRNGSGNINYAGTIAAGETTAEFDSVPNADATMFRINNAIVDATYNIFITTIKVIDNIEQNANQINLVNNTLQNIKDKTPITDVLTFKVGYWRGVSDFAVGADYRVGANAFTFDKEVIIATYDGYSLIGYLDGVYFQQSTLVVPKNKELKLSIRKVWEDQNPVTVDEMTENTFILNYNPLTEYELLENSFAGIEIFRTAGFIGDSYTATRLGHSWVDIIHGKTGVQCIKYAKSGDDASAWISDAANGLPVVLTDTPKDLYWIALGINDGGRVDSDASYLGSVADLSGVYTDYPDTFWGNMGHIIEAIQAHAPSAKIVLYKPIFRSTQRTLQGVSATKNGIADVRNAIGQIAEHYNLPFMDALDDVFYHSYFYVFHMDYDIGAGTHPSVLLYSGIASANMRLFSKCVQKFASYFMGISYAD